MIKKLIGLANRLDTSGFKKEADFIDLLTKICIAEEEIDKGMIEDMEKLMHGWDTEHAPDFPKLRNDSPYRPSQFTLDKADIWYTYSTLNYDEHDREVKALDTMETMHKFDGDEQKPNMAALIVFPDGLDFVLNFEAGTSVMSSQSHSEDGNEPSYYDVLGEVDGNDVRKYGTLVTNEEFKAYAKEHGFNHGV